MSYMLPWVAPVLAVESVYFPVTVDRALHKEGNVWHGYFYGFSGFYKNMYNFGKKHLLKLPNLAIESQ